MASLTTADELSRSYRQPRTLQGIRMQSSGSRMSDEDSGMAAVEELCRDREQPKGVRQKSLGRTWLGVNLGQSLLGWLSPTLDHHSPALFHLSVTLSATSQGPIWVLQGPSARCWAASRCGFGASS